MRSFFIFLDCSAKYSHNASNIESPLRDIIGITTLASHDNASKAIDIAPLSNVSVHVAVVAVTSADATVAANAMPIKIKVNKIDKDMIFFIKFPPNIYTEFIIAFILWNVKWRTCLPIINYSKYALPHLLILMIVFPCDFSFIYMPILCRRE